MLSTRKARQQDRGGRGGDDVEQELAPLGTSLQKTTPCLRGQHLDYFVDVLGRMNPKNTFRWPEAWKWHQWHLTSALLWHELCGLKACYLLRIYVPNPIAILIRWPEACLLHATKDKQTVFLLSPGKNYAVTPTSSYRLPGWPSDKVSFSRPGDTGIESGFSRSSYISDLRMDYSSWLQCQAPGVIRSELGLVDPESVQCDLMRK